MAESHTRMARMLWDVVLQLVVDSDRVPRCLFIEGFPRIAACLQSVISIGNGHSRWPPKFMMGAIMWVIGFSLIAPS